MNSRSDPTRRDVAVAGHVGDVDTARSALEASEPAVRATALGALARLDMLSPAELVVGVADSAAVVRRRSAELAAHHPTVDLLPLLDDPDVTVIEMAVWAIGERESDDSRTVALLDALARDHDEPLVREAAVASLGAIGAEGGRGAILNALDDKPAVRRRAVLALAPFDGDEVDAAIERALTDRDWQVRQAAEDLRRAMR